MTPRKHWADRGLELLARFGLLARGAVYVVVGFVAARVAVEERGRATGPAGALNTILRGWHGRVALVFVAAGLFCFLFFRVAQTVRAKGRFARLVFFLSAVGILALFLSAVGLLFGLRASPEGFSFRDWDARLLGEEWGRASLELGGAIAAVAGVVEAIRAILGKLPSDFAAALIARPAKRGVFALARVGVLAHGIVITIVGVSIFTAAVDANERELVGIGGALHKLSVLHAPVLFVVVSAGLLAYGLSLIVLSAHGRRRIG